MEADLKILFKKEITNESGNLVPSDVFTGFGSDGLMFLVPKSLRKNMR